MIVNLLRTVLHKKAIWIMSKLESCYQELGQLKKFEETADVNRYKKELKWYTATIKS